MTTSVAHEATGLVAMWRFLPILVTVCLEVFQGSTCRASVVHPADTLYLRATRCLAEKPLHCTAESCDTSTGAAIIAEGESPEDDDHLSRGAGGPNCLMTALDLASAARLAAQSALLGPARPFRILFECWRN